MRTPDDLDRAERFFADRGCPTQRVPAGTTPGFGEAVRAVDPLGFTIELVHHIDRVEPLVQRYDLRRGASINRLDHINIAMPDVPVAFELLHVARLRAERDDRGLRDGTLYAAWMFRKQTVHDVAFTLGSGPMLHHVAFAVPESHNILSPVRHRSAPSTRPSTSSAGPGDTGCRTRSTCTCATTTGIGSRSTRPTTSPVIRVTSRSAGTSTTSAAATSGAIAVVPTWYLGSVGMLDLDGNPVARPRAGADRAQGDRRRRRARHDRRRLSTASYAAARPGAGRGWPSDSRPIETSVHTTNAIDSGRDVPSNWLVDHERDHGPERARDHPDDRRRRARHVGERLHRRRR